MRGSKFLWAALGLALGGAGEAVAQDAALDSGDTAWMLTSTALVLMMTMERKGRRCVGDPDVEDRRRPGFQLPPQPDAAKQALGG